MGNVIGTRPELREMLWDTTICAERICGQLETSPSQKACRNALKAIRGLIIKQIDSAFPVIRVEDPLSYRKALKWKDYKDREHVVANELYKNRSNISQSTVKDCLYIFRDLKECIKFKRQALSRQPHCQSCSLFSSISLNERGSSNTVERQNIRIGTEVSKVVDSFRQDGRTGRTFRKEIRGLRDTLLYILDTYTKVPRGQSKCLYLEDLKRYEQELDYVLESQPRFGGKDTDTILKQYITQLQLCVFSMDESQVKKFQHIVEKGSLRIFPVPENDDTSDDELSDGDSSEIENIEKRMEKERKKSETKKALMEEFMRVLQVVKSENSADEHTSIDENMKIQLLIKVYETQLKHYCEDVAEDLPDFRSGSLQALFNEEVEREKTMQKLRDVDAYIRDVRKALEEKPLQSTDDLNVYLDRQRSIMMQMENDRWKELNLIENYIRGHNTEEEENSSDIVEDDKETQTITTAQVAILEKAEEAIQNPKLKVAEIVKDQIAFCKKHDRDYRERKDAQVAIKKSKLSEHIDEQEFGSDAEKVQTIEKDIENKYSDIEKLALEIDISDSDFEEEKVNGGDKKLRLMDDMKKCVEDLQQLTRDLFQLKNRDVYNIDAKLAEIQATQHDLKDDLQNMLQEIQSLITSVKKKKVNNDVLQEYTNDTLSIVKEFDGKRQDKFKEKFKKEEALPDKDVINQFMQLMMTRPCDDEVITLLKDMTTTIEMNASHGKRGNATLTVQGALDLKRFLEDLHKNPS